MLRTQKERKKERKKVRKNFLLFLLHLAPLNSLKNTSKKTSDAVEVTFYDAKTTRDDVAFLKQEFLQFKEEVRFHFAKLNSSGTYVSDFFPANDNSDIERFLKNDANLQKRKDSLYLLLMTCDGETPRKFSDTFLKILFTQDYLATYIWPLGW